MADRVTDTCSHCTKLVIAGDGAVFLDDRTRHLACYLGEDGASPPSPPETSYLVGVHVLLVEDSDEGREMLEAALRYCGAFVTAVSTVEEGRRRLREVRPHVIVTDLTMPHNGLAIIEAVQTFAAEVGLDIPAVVITAYHDRQQAAREAGFVAFITKPLDPFTLAAVVRRVAKRARPGA